MRMTKTVLLYLGCIILLPSFLKAQNNLNMVLQDSLTYHVGVNDVMGWVDPEGNEYALVGLNTGVSIVNIDSTPVREVVFVPGVDNLWRDINTYGHYAYVTSEARVGLLIIDLQYLPDSVVTYVWKDSLPTPNGLKPFEKAHTLWIDEYGIAYLNGSNLNSGGVILIDVASNPTDPVFLGFAPPIYSHDVYARDSILYSAEIYDGVVSIYDVHRPDSIFMIGQVKTPNEFTHNAWLSEDSRYMFTTDERSNSYVASYDIQDPGNIIELDRFRQASTNGSGNIPHNVYVWNDWLVIAYYTSGTLIVDASRPENLVEVGSFDSFLGADGGFSGVWGSWPFLPSGKIISSDRNSGLYVFIPNYVRAAFIEGQVLDSITKDPILGAVVTITSDEIVLPQVTKLDGTFKTGKAIPGTYTVTIRKNGYYPKTLQLAFENGLVLTPLIELNPLPTYVFSGKVIDINDKEVPFANVTLMGFDGVYETEANETGDFFFPAVFGGVYEVEAGVWGQTVQTFILVNGPQDVVLRVMPGYRDDFDTDLGWVVSGDADEGSWTRGIPSGQQLFNLWQCGSSTDSPFDRGDFAYSTGLAGAVPAENDEVSGGTTWLASPPMDLDSIQIAHINFDYWLCEFPPNQYYGFNVWLTNGIDTTLLSQLDNDTIVGSWQTVFSSVDMTQWPSPRDSIKILFSAQDTTTQGDYILKVHIDNFYLVEGSVGTKDEIATSNKFELYPNPVVGREIFLKSANGIKGEQLTLVMFDVHGRLVSAQSVSRSEAESGIIHALEDGFYFIQWKSDADESGVEKILVRTNN